jgi:hypothetical protein
VTFTQISATAFHSRDAVRFKNEYEIKLRASWKGNVFGRQRKPWIPNSKCSPRVLVDISKGRADKAEGRAKAPMTDLDAWEIRGRSPTNDPLSEISS